MKVLIVSDTHRKNENFLKVLELVGKVDKVIHCGDIEGSEVVISEAAGCEVCMVSGNNDFFSDLPDEAELSVGGRKVWVVHGHHYYVSMGTQFLITEARSRGVDVVCFGHTHRPCVEYENGVIAVNPGSLSYPRQDGRQPSFILMETDRFGELHFTVNYMENGKIVRQE